MFLVQESFEHSLFGVVGAWLQAEQGKVALQNNPLLSGGQWVRSFGLGLTVKAGGFPMLTIAWARKIPKDTTSCSRSTRPCWEALRAVASVTALE